jgi:hypothetical protein
VNVLAYEVCNGLERITSLFISIFLSPGALDTHDGRETQAVRGQHGPTATGLNPAMAWNTPPDQLFKTTETSRLKTAIVYRPVLPCTSSSSRCGRRPEWAGGGHWPRQKFSDTGGSAPAGGDFGKHPRTTNPNNTSFPLRIESQNYNHIKHSEGMLHTYQSTAALENW